MNLIFSFEKEKHVNVLMFSNETYQNIHIHRKWESTVEHSMRAMKDHLHSL